MIVVSVVKVYGIILLPKYRFFGLKYIELCFVAYMKTNRYRRGISMLLIFNGSMQMNACVAICDICYWCRILDSIVIFYFCSASFALVCAVVGWCMVLM